MATQPTNYDDGNWAAGFSVGFDRVTYPFANNPTPDVSARITQQTLAQNPVSYSPSIAALRVGRNLFLYSEQFDNAAWVTGAASVTPNSTANPKDGAITADKLVEANNINNHGISQSYTDPLGQSVFTVSAKPNGRTFIALYVFDAASVPHYCFFDIQNGLVMPTQSAILSAAISPAGNGFFDCSITVGTATPGTSNAVIFLSADGVNFNYPGNGSSGAFIYAASLEYGIGTFPAAYVPTTSAATNVSWPYADGTVDRFAFLSQEDPMVLTDIQKANINRYYARIPADQVYPASRIVVRPVMNDIHNGSYYAVSFDAGYTSTVWTSRVTVSTIGTDVPPTTPVAVITSVPAATYSNLPADVITMKTTNHTASFFLNGVASGIQTTLAAGLTDIANITCVGSANSLSVSWNNGAGVMLYVSSTTSARVSSGGTSVSFEMATGGGNVSQSTAWNYTPNVLQSVRVVNSTGHGGTAGDYVAIWNQDKLSCVSRVVTAINPNQFTIPLSDLPGNDIVVTHCAFAKSGTRYVNGPKECVVRKTQKFYFPGVTPGINSFADIPRYIPDTDPIRWLQAIQSGNTYAVESVSDLTQWRGQILVQELNEVLMSDALTTVTAGA